MSTDPEAVEDSAEALAVILAVFAEYLDDEQKGRAAAHLRNLAWANRQRAPQQAQMFLDVALVLTPEPTV